MRVWLYGRLSNDDDVMMNSLENQLEIVREYARKQGYEIVGESYDDNVSGMRFEIDKHRILLLSKSDAADD